jgi:hypothetical protein
MRRMTAKERFDLVMSTLMREGDKLMDDAFGDAGHKLLNEAEKTLGFEITPYGSWSNQAGLIYEPVGLIYKDKGGYYFTGLPVDSADWAQSKLPKGLNLVWVAKNFPSLKGLIDEVFVFRKRAHSSLPASHVSRQPEFSSPNGLVLKGVERAHIVDAQLIGPRSDETMIDAILIPATAHVALSYFSSENFVESEMTATRESSGDIKVEISVVNPAFYHPDCANRVTIHSIGLTAEDSDGLLKMFALRKVLKQLRSDILRKWESAHAEKQAA